MKIVDIEPCKKFKPFAIHVETEDDAKALWFCMCGSPQEAIDDAAERGENDLPIAEIWTQITDATQDF